MDFGLDDEQRAIVDTVRAFVANELYPHEDEVERLGDVPPALVDEIRGEGDQGRSLCREHARGAGRRRPRRMGMTLFERELGTRQLRAAIAGRAPEQHPAACEGEQLERYLLPTVRGDRIDCLAMTEPGAGSDLRSMTTRAVRDGDDYVIDGTKHFISNADEADFVILFAATGDRGDARGRSEAITGFLVDMDTAGPHRDARARRASRTAASTTASWRSTAAACRRPTAGRRGRAAST